MAHSNCNASYSKQGVIWQSYSVKATISCVWQKASDECASPHLVLIVVIVSQSLAVLVQLAHQHLARAEIKGAEVHLVTKVTGQLRLAPKLLPRWTGRGGSDKMWETTTLNIISNKNTQVKNKRHRHGKLNGDEGERNTTDRSHFEHVHSGHWVTHQDHNMQQVKSEEKQSTVKWAMTLKSRYFVTWMQYIWWTLCLKPVIY